MSASGTLRAYGDLAFMNGDLMLSGNKNNITNAYMRLGRTDPDGGLLGPLAATTWELGDVGTTSVPLVTHNQSGRGSRITSRSASFLAEFDRLTLEDVLPPNYEVELYRNDILMAAQRTNTNGKYRFEDVILLRGQNTIRLEFYGPQGQRRTETKAYYVGDSRVPVGSFQYDVSAHQVGRTLFNVNPNSNQGSTDALGGAISFDYGLTRSVSLTAGLVTAPLTNNKSTTTTDSDTIRNYATLGLRTQVMGIGVALDSAFDDIGGQAYGISTQTRFSSWDVAVDHDIYRQNFLSNAATDTGKDKKDRQRRTFSSGRIQRTFNPLNSRLNINFGISSDYTTYIDQSEAWTLGNDLGISYTGIYLSNNIRYNASANDGSSNGTVNLNVSLFDDWSLRVGANYASTSSLIFNTYSMGLTTYLPRSYNLNLGYNRNLTDPEQPSTEGYQTYTLSVTKDFPTLSLGFQVSYNDYENSDLNTGWSVAATTKFGLFTDNDTGNVKMLGTNIGGRGGLRTRAFLDNNANGELDPNEPLLTGIKVLSSAYAKPYTTQADVVPMEQLSSTGNWIDVSLDAKDMPDPSLAPGNAGKSVLLRPGVISTLDLPVITTADIEGAVTLRIGEKLRPLPNVMVQVVRSNITGQKIVVAQALTEFDGLFTINNIPIGTYQVRVLPEQAKQIGLLQTVIPTITLASNTGLLEQVNIELGRSPAN